MFGDNILFSCTAFEIFHDLVYNVVCGIEQVFVLLFLLLTEIMTHALQQCTRCLLSPNSDFTCPLLYTITLYVAFELTFNHYRPHSVSKVALGNVRNVVQALPFCFYRPPYCHSVRDLMERLPLLHLPAAIAYFLVFVVVPILYVGTAVVSLRNLVGNHIFNVVLLAVTSVSVAYVSFGW